MPPLTTTLSVYLWNEMRGNMEVGMFYASSSIITSSLICHQVAGIEGKGGVAKLRKKGSG